MDESGSEKTVFVALTKWNLMKSNLPFIPVMLIGLCLICSKSEQSKGLLEKRILFKLAVKHNCQISDSILKITPFDTAIICFIINDAKETIPLSKWQNAIVKFVNNDTCHYWTDKFNNSFTKELNYKLPKQNSSCIISFSQIGYDSISQYGIVKYDYNCGIKCRKKGYALFKSNLDQTDIIKYLTYSEE